MDLFPAVLMISHSLPHGLHNLYNSHNFSLQLARSNLLVPLLLPTLPDFETLPSYPVWAPFPNLLCSMHSSLSRLCHTGPHGPTILHNNRSPGPHATTSRITSLHQGHAPCSRHDSARLITAYPLTTSCHVPSFQTGPSAPALIRTARTSSLQSQS